jgi:hypothetical protein
LHYALHHIQKNLEIHYIIYHFEFLFNQFILKKIKGR